MCFYFLIQVKMIIIRNRIFSNSSVKIYIIRSVYAFMYIYVCVDRGEKIVTRKEPSCQFLFLREKFK